MKARITAIAGDGIGPEIVNSSKRVLEAVAQKYGHVFEFDDCLIGGAAIDATGHPLPEKTLASAKASDAVLLGSVGGPKWDNAPVRPESALLAIRKELGLYANLRPAKLYAPLAKASVLKRDICDRGIDIMTVRELTGGIYFGERGYTDSPLGRAAFDTEFYAELEIERVARIAFEAAMLRSKKLCLVDKANVLLSSKLWRKVVTEINEDYPAVTVDMMYVDNTAMQLAICPSQFDVLLTSNMFGDILSDLTAAIIGSIGIMPSASLGATTVGMYEAIHGSAPSIAGLGIANPVGTILSAAMLLRHSLDLANEAAAIEQAVEQTFALGLTTRDLGGTLSTDQVTDEIIKIIKAIS